MARDRSDAERVAILRDELLARNEITRLERRGQTPSAPLRARLREASLGDLLAKIDNETAIVDGDQRIEITATRPEVQGVGASVALICSRLDLGGPTSPQARWSLNGRLFLCAGQNFAGEPGLESRGNTPATGFLVGASGRYVLTARHVAVDNLGRLNPQLYCVFGYRQENGTVVQSFGRSEVFAVRSLVEWGRGIDDDWALVELEASTGRAGLPLRTNGAPSVGDSVIAIGHPHGLPMKSGTGTIRDITSALYEADLDIGTGNSGSPVISVDATGRPVLVEGIVVAALDDLMFVEQNNCAVWMNSTSPDRPQYWAGFVPIAHVLANAHFRATVFP